MARISKKVRDSLYDIDDKVWQEIANALADLSLSDGDDDPYADYHPDN